MCHAGAQRQQWPFTPRPNTQSSKRNLSSSVWGGGCCAGKQRRSASLLVYIPGHSGQPPEQLLSGEAAKAIFIFVDLHEQEMRFSLSLAAFRTQKGGSHLHVLQADPALKSQTNVQLLQTRYGHHHDHEPLLLTTLVRLIPVTPNPCSSWSTITTNKVTAIPKLSDCSCF